jgi:hypothetical protein
MSKEEITPDQGTTSQPPFPKTPPLSSAIIQSKRSQKPPFPVYNPKSIFHKNKNRAISPTAKTSEPTVRTAQVGQIFVIENAELEYKFATTLNKEVLKEVDPGPGAGSKWHVCDWVQAYKEFRKCYGDDYDFVAMVPDVQIDGIGKISANGMPNFIPHHVHVFNNIVGINYDYGDYYDIRPYFGSTRLQGIAALTPQLASIGMTRLHELGHRWGAYVLFKRNPSDPSNHRDLLKAEFNHWSENFDSGFSSMADTSGTNWIDRHDGTFEKRTYFPVDEQFSYCPLDLYLMGMFAPAEVGNFFYIANPKEVNKDLALYSGTRVDLGVENIVWAHGPRQPHAAYSQRSFRLACVVLTKDLDRGIQGAESLQKYRLAVTEQFREATRSRGMLDTHLYDSSYDGVYMRHHDLDTGIEPSHGVFWNSPDIWVRNDNGLQDKLVYVRVRNNGAKPTREVTVNLFQSDYSGIEFLYPQDWIWDDQHRIDESKIIGSVPAGGEETVCFKWNKTKAASAASKHLCLLAEILPTHPTQTKLRYVWEDRRIAQKNVTILSPTPGTTELAFRFLIGAHSLPKRSVRIRVEQKGGSRLDQVSLELGETNEEGAYKTRGGHLTQHNGSVALIIDDVQEGGDVTLPLSEAEQKRLTLRVKWDEASPPTDVRFAITQLNEQYEVVGGLDLLFENGRSEHN